MSPPWRSKVLSKYCQGQTDGEDHIWCLYDYYSYPEGVGSNRNTAMGNRIGGIMVFLYDQCFHNGGDRSNINTVIAKSKWKTLVVYMSNVPIVKI